MNTHKLALIGVAICYGVTIFGAVTTGEIPLWIFISWTAIGFVCGFSVCMEVMAYLKRKNKQTPIKSIDITKS